MSAKVTQKGPGIKKLKAALRGAAVTVGIHEEQGSVPKTGDDGKSSGLSLVEVATSHELGIGVPNRSFIGAWFDGNEPKLKTVVDRIAAAAAKNHRPVAQALARFGLWAAGNIQQRIADGISPELSDRRKAEKAKANLAGNAKDTPLIFWGQLRSSIMSKIEQKEQT